MKVEQENAGHLQQNYIFCLTNEFHWYCPLSKFNLDIQYEYELCGRILC
jgi:hypothetical protein